MSRKKSKNLVIVESPAKAKTINKFMGRKYKVEASMGHIIDLPKSKLGIDIDSNFKPKYITIRGKGKILNKLKKEAKKSKKILLATDPDREGEAISWHLARALGIENEKNRIEFNEITDSAIKKAIKNPREIDDHLVNAQQARRLLDRLVGYRLSPLLWKKVRKGLSAGRVQTVAVKIICEREREIKAFEPEEYWTVTAFLKRNNDKFEADLYRIKGKKINITSKNEVNKIVNDIKKNKFIIENINEQERKSHPNPPFTTSTMQQRAASKLGFTAKKTMYIAQQLYEGIDLGNEGTSGLISYIRTDSKRISSEAKNEAQNYINKKFGSKYSPGKEKKYKTSEKAQDAHEAIRPTSVFREPEKIKKYLTRDQFKLYDLIWRRFVASQMSSAIYKTLTVDIKAGDKFLFRASGSEILFPGYYRVLNGKNDRNQLPDLEENDKLDLKKLEPEQHFTQPPPRFTEASLVKTLEEEGIGRPSTYAPTISTIISREYVEKNGKYLKPTELGSTVTDLLSDYFPDVTDIEFTAQLEERLDNIEEGNNNWKELLKDFYFPFSERLEKAEKEMERVNLVEKTDEICDKCGKPMVVKYGRYGKFLACSGYPECKNTKPYVEKTGVSCPQCNNGELIKRKSKKGKVFYGCSNYPDCKFVVWNKPVKEKCPKCGGLMVKKKSRKKGEYYKCINNECKYEYIPAEG